MELDPEADNFGEILHEFKYADYTQPLHHLYYSPTVRPGLHSLRRVSIGRSEYSLSPSARFTAGESEVSNGAHPLQLHAQTYEINR